MKNLVKLFAVALVAAGTVGCSYSPEEDNTAAPTPKGVNITMTASADGSAATRTALGKTENNSYKYEWSAGDKIGISIIKDDAEVLTPVALKAAASGTSTTFGGTITEAEAEKIPAASLYDYVGWYPSTVTYNHSAESFSYTLPAQHSASSNVFSGACDMMIGHAEGRSTIAVSDGMYPLSMSFQHVFAFFEIPLQGNNMSHKISRITIEAASSALAGGVEVGFDESGAPEVQNISGGSRKITIDVPAGWNTSESIWVPFIPGVAGEKVTITLYNQADLVWSFAKTAPAAGFTRANVYRMNGAAPEFDIPVSLDKLITLINNDASKSIKDPTALQATVSASGVEASYIEDMGVIYSVDGGANTKVSMANGALSANNTWAGLSAGKYTVRGYATVGGVDFVSDAKSVDVFGNVALSVVAPTSYSWYVGDNGISKNTSTANTKDRFTIYAPTATMTAADSRYAGYANLLTDCVSGYSIKEGSNALSVTTSGTQFSAANFTKSVGSYTITASVNVPTQGTVTAQTTSHVTGLPYIVSVAKSGDGWSTSGTNSFESSYWQFGAQASGKVSGTMTFYAPANIPVAITLNKIEMYSTTKYAAVTTHLYCSGTEYAEKEGESRLFQATTDTWNPGTSNQTLTTGNPTFKIETTGHVAYLWARIYGIDIRYR